jgi:predicted acylesterase/phospholipase RssA
VVQFLEKLTDEKTFADLAADLKVIASDLLTEREYVFSRAPDRVRSGRVRERSLR